MVMMKPRPKGETHPPFWENLSFLPYQTPFGSVPLEDVWKGRD